MPKFTERLAHAWNAFRNNRDPTPYSGEMIEATSFRSDRRRYSFGNDRTIVTAILTRIAVDVAAIDIKHIRTDMNDRYISTVRSNLNNVLTVEANIDQTGRAFIKDVVMSMLDEGVVAIVPTDTSVNPNIGGAFDVKKVRVGKVVTWYPKHVKVRLYDENSGRHKEVTYSKKAVAIIENPFYEVMNEQNSVAKRLIRKLTLLDMLDEQTANGKLDLIIQLPYAVHTDLRRKEADSRRKSIEEQLSNKKLGIAWIDATEKITQLNRPIENNLQSQIEYLTKTLYGQLGITEEILNCTASEMVMLNYYNHVIEPIASAIVEEISRKFLTQTSRTQGQSVKFFRDPFKLVPINNIADIADRFTRNEILAPNEVRGIIGFRPSEDPKADELRNRNIAQSNEMAGPPGEEVIYDQDGNPVQEEPVIVGYDEYGNPIYDQNGSEMI